MAKKTTNIADGYGYENKEKGDMKDISHFLRHMTILAKNLGIQGAGSPAAAEGRCSGCQRSQRPTTATGAVKEPYRGRAAAAVLLRSTLIW